MRIGIAKPDYGIRGGFEIVLDRIVRELECAGHEVGWLSPAVRHLPPEPYGVAVPAEVWNAAPEYFRYMSLFEAFQLLDASTYDLLLATQPPSFAVPHPRKLALFFHHHRLYYDLAEMYVRAGFAPADLHRAGVERIRALDQPAMDEVGWFLAGSEHVAERLERYNGAADRTSVCHVGLKYDVVREPAPAPADGPVLCVTRHEFPKRAELMVHAMKLLPSRAGVIVGTGGRLGWAKELDRRLSADASVDPEALWLVSDLPDDEEQPYDSNISFVDGIDDDELSSLYERSAVVVAPAYMEDYGLTALEAMAHGRPVVVCADGGGLVDLVAHEFNGLIVDPSGPAIAAAVDRLLTDHQLRRELSQNAAVYASGFSWERTMAEFEIGLQKVTA